MDVQEKKAVIAQVRKAQRSFQDPESVEGKMFLIEQNVDVTVDKLDEEDARLVKDARLTAVGRVERMQPMAEGAIKSIEQHQEPQRVIDKADKVLAAAPAIMEEMDVFQKATLEDFMRMSQPQRAKYAQFEGADPKVAAVLVKAGQRLTRLTDATHHLLESILYSDDEVAKRDKAESRKKAAEIAQLSQARAIKSIKERYDATGNG